MTDDEEKAVTLFEELEHTNVNKLNLHVDCCCGLLKTSPFHQPKPRINVSSGCSKGHFSRENSEARSRSRYENIKSIESNVFSSFYLHRRRSSIYDSSSGENSVSSTASSLIEDISDKISDIKDIDTNIHMLMCKSIEVHTDLLDLEAQTNRLIADTRKIADDLSDVKFLDELIEFLNSDMGPVIHREWPYRILFDGPIEEGTAVT